MSLPACAVCGAAAPDYAALAAHLRERADASEGRHVMWLNRHVSLREIPEAEIARWLEARDVSAGPRS